MYNSAEYLNEKQLFDTWAPVLERTTGVTDKMKLKWLSKLAQNQKLNEDALENVHMNPNSNIMGMGAVSVANPATPSTPGTWGSGDKMFALLPMAMQVATQTFALDLVNVIPMNGPLGMMTYIDNTYAGGRLDSKESPFVIKIKVNIVTGQESLFKEGLTYYVNQGTATTNTYALTYIGNSWVDGFAIFRVIATETTGALREIGAPGNVSVLQATSVGQLYSSATGTSQIADFGSEPDFVKAPEDQISGYVSRSLRLGDGVTNAEEGYWREEGELTPASMMGIQFRSKSVTARTYKVAAAATQEQIADMKLYGVNVMQNLEDTLTNEMMQTLNRLILNRMFKLGASSHVKWFNNHGENFNLNLDSASRPIFLGEAMDNTQLPGMMTDGIAQILPGENHENMQKRIMTILLAAKNAIWSHTNRSEGQFIVTNPKIASVLQSISSYTPTPMANTISQTASLKNIGTIVGLSVYVDPRMRWNDTRILVGRKGEDNNGLVFMPYLMAQSTQIIAESTMAPKIAVTSRFALVEAGHYPEDNYLTIKVEEGNIVNNILF